MDETRLDLYAADQERMEQWREAYRQSRRTLNNVMRSGAALYPIVGRSGGRLYGTPRLPPPSEVIEAREDRDEEIKMPEAGRVQRSTYEEALELATKHAMEAGAYAGSSRTDYLEKAQAHALTSRAWSALAGLLRADEVRVDTAAYMQRLQEMGLSPTGRKRDYVRTPSPEAQRLLDEAAEVRTETEAQKDGV